MIQDSTQAVKLLEGLKEMLVTAIANLTQERCPHGPMKIEDLEVASHDEYILAVWKNRALISSDATSDTWDLFDLPADTLVGLFCEIEKQKTAKPYRDWPAD